MTDEQAMREARARQWLDSMFDGHMHEVTNVLALLDDKDAAILELQDRVNEVEEQLVGVQCDLRVAKAFRKAFKTQRDERTAERDTALSRAEQAEAALAERDAAIAEVMDRVHECSARYDSVCTRTFASVVEPLRRFILPANPADPHWVALAERAEELAAATESETSRNFMLEFAEKARAKAIERAGGTISFEGEG